MNTFKSLGLAALAATALITTQAFATTCPIVNGVQTEGSPVCMDPTNLQNVFDSITTSGTPISATSDQYSPSSLWSLGASGIGGNTTVSLVSTTDIISFGIFDPTASDPTAAGSYLPLLYGSWGAGAKTALSYNGSGSFTATYLNGTSPVSATFGDGNLFGYYLQMSGGFFFSVPSMNEGGMPQMAAYAGNGSYINVGTGSAQFQSGEWILAWEGTPWAQSNLDYSDFVVLVESVHPVPEPAVLGMFGLGVLMLGGFAALRRRYNV